jgi:arabinofuranosyltransferase
LPDGFLAPLGALVFVALPAVWSLAPVGLETGLTFFWLGASLAILVSWAGDSDVCAWSLILLGLGPLVRPELGIDSLVFVGILLMVDRSGRTWRAQVRILAWAAAIPQAYQVFRMGCYGLVVANTPVARAASIPRVDRGLRVFMDFAGTYWMVIPAICLAVGAFPPLASALKRTDRGSRNLTAPFALPVAGTFNAVSIVLMGGDYVHGRLLVAPPFALVAPVAVVPVGQRYAISLLLIPWALLFDRVPLGRFQLLLVPTFPGGNRQWPCGSGRLGRDPSGAVRPPGVCHRCMDAVRRQLGRRSGYGRPWRRDSACR